MLWHESLTLYRLSDCSTSSAFLFSLFYFSKCLSFVVLEGDSTLVYFWHWCDSVSVSLLFMEGWVQIASGVLEIIWWYCHMWLIRNLWMCSCKSCGQRAFNCPGHCGHIDLVTPVYNPLLFNVLHNLLQSTCFFCLHFRASRSQVVWPYLVFIMLLSFIEHL